MKKWICQVCHYVHEGPEPPDPCPVCGASAAVFEELSPTEPGVPATAAEAMAAVDEPRTLVEVRERAQKRMLGLCGVYPHCDGQPDRICQREAYGGRIGLGGAGSGASFRANVEALGRVRLATRLVGEPFEPDTRLTFLGVPLSMPIMAASASGLGGWGGPDEEREMCFGAVTGCRQAGTLGWRGDTVHYTLEDNPGLDAIAREGGHGVAIFKPRAQDELLRRIARAEALGARAVGVDLDGCGSTNFARAGQPVYRKTVADLRALVQATSLPFIAKGIMGVPDAEACVEAGVAVVAVSNHGGRVLDGTPGVAEVLPAIVDRIGGKVTITADGGVRTGFDVLKLLALGAHAVLVGRDVVRAALGGGATGVRLQMEHLRTVLARAMILTGCPDLASIERHVLA